jgi:hypothetical protein
LEPALEQFLEAFLQALDFVGSQELIQLEISVLVKRADLLRCEHRFTSLPGARRAVLPAVSLQPAVT